MATYRKSDPEVSALVADVMQSTYPELAEHGVTVEVMDALAKRNAETGEPDGPAITHQGWPAMAVVKVNSQRDRAAGLCDARITVDGDEWPRWTDAVRRAVIDHELQHLELRVDEDGAVLLDDCNRPRLRLRPHDFQLGGFSAIVSRHGENAPEFRSLESARKQLATWAPETTEGQP